jgi:uncharacterized membrane protein
MENMMVIVFETETAVHDGALALKQLDEQGQISVHSIAVIEKNSDGTVGLAEEDEFPTYAIKGTAVGSLIGLLEGPLGAVEGAKSGAMVGAADDLYNSEVNAEFLQKVASELSPSKYAVVADVSEEKMDPINTKMKALGGKIFRADKNAIENEQIKTFDKQISQMEKEKKSAERKAEIQTKIDELKAKRQRIIDRAKMRMEKTKREFKDKVQSLKKKSAN